ncbi:FUSC family protein [Ornithinimicrobium pratense]|nr:FUSC family protein [Ornithinimicrobium pratense]
MRPDPDLRRDPVLWLRRVRPRTRLIRMVRRVQRHAPHLLLAAAAAGIAYFLASLAFGPEHAIFAPIAAVVAVGLSAGQRLVRAVEISAGVVLGLVMADVLTRVIGAGTWQLAVAVLLAMSAAVALRASTLMANQAAVAAVFVMVLVPLQDTPPLIRLADAVIGGLVAIGLNAVLAPDPHRVALDTSEQLLDRLAVAYRRLSRALDGRDYPLAERTLADLEQLETSGRDLETAIDATRERITLGRSRTRAAQRRRLRLMEQLAVRAGVMVTSARSTSRAVSTMARHRQHADPALVTALEQLSQALLDLRSWVRGQARMTVIQDQVLRTARMASTILRTGEAAAAEQALAWQVRAACVDILRVLGLSYSAAVAALEDAAGRADRPPT